MCSSWCSSDACSAGSLWHGAQLVQPELHCSPAEQLSFHTSGRNCPTRDDSESEASVAISDDTDSEAEREVRRKRKRQGDGNGSGKAKGGGRRTRKAA